MIKANELRIGNWVYYGESIRPITAIHETSQRRAVGVSNLLTEFESIKPIPLTPEILEKCGFEKSTDHYGGYLSPKFDLAAIRIKDNNTWFNGCWETKVEHLHQLQNLYLALTGEELEIKF